MIQVFVVIFKEEVKYGRLGFCSQFIARVGKAGIVDTNYLKE